MAAEAPSDSPDAERLKPLLLGAVEANDAEACKALLEPLHPVDAADLLKTLPQEQQLLAMTALHSDTLSAVLAYMDEQSRDDIIHDLGIDTLAAAVTELDTDDALEVIHDLSESEQADLLAAMPDEERLLLEESLSYENDTAGRLMQRSLVAVPEHWTVGQTIDFLRDSHDLPDDFYDIFIVDPRHKPLGAVALSRILKARRNILIKDLMHTDLRTTSVGTDQEEVAFLFRRYGLVSLPVIDTAGRLVGVIVVDDVVDVIDEEADEDFLRLSGVQGARDLYKATWSSVQNRFSWLAINLLTAVLASLVISVFEDTLQKIVALAVLMPIVASMGGNSGTQSLAIFVRALAMRQLNKSNTKRLVLRECLIGTINGLLFAILAGVMAWVWYHDVVIGVVIGFAMIVNLIVANLSGALIPIGLKRLGIDPAIASGVFLTTVTDVVGFFAFLGLATWFL